MKKILLLSVVLGLFILSAHGQADAGKFSSGLGFGYRQNYNNMLYPYTFAGGDYSLNLDWQSVTAKNWLWGMNVQLHYSPIYLSNSAVNVKRYAASQQFLEAEVQYRQLKKIHPLSTAKFSLYAGGNFDTKVQYQLYSGIEDGHSFLSLDFLVEASLHGEYKLGKTIISDHFSVLLLACVFYPHYGNNDPLVSSGSAGNYFVVAPIGTLNRFSNYLKFEFPIFINKNLCNTFYLGYNFNYEYSTIRDNPIENINHIFLFGLIFKISKLKYR